MTFVRHAQLAAQYRSEVFRTWINAVWAGSHNGVNVEKRQL